jgi:secreted Zn-dependent insulinase-like peptidase
LNINNCIINLYSQSHGKKLSEHGGDSEDDYGDDDNVTESDTEDSDYGIEYQKEPWYGAKYVKEKIPVHLVEKITFPTLPEDCRMGDPLVNTLFPNDLTILDKNESDPKVPEMIINDKNMEVWHYKCTQFKVPTIIITDTFYTKD